MIDIAMLEAGRELDALVAELALGFRWEEWQTGRGLYDQENIKRGKRFHNNKLAFEEVPPMGQEAVSTRPLPHYSTDIASAWAVVHEMRRRGFDFKMEQSGAHHYVGSNGRFTVFNEKTMVSFTCHNAVCSEEKGPGVDWHGAAGGNGHGAELEAETAPLAICRAALKALGADQ